MTRRAVTQSTKLSGWYGFLLLLLLIILPSVALLVPEESMLLAWLATMALLVVLTTLIGRAITGFWRGALIDERNRLSLSRVQVFVWTVLVLSGFLIAASLNIRAGKADPLAIDVPAELWLLMGIGTTTLVATPFIQSIKKDQLADPNEARRTFALMSQQRGVDDVCAQVTNVGQVVVNLSPADARWSDLFTGEEVGNAAHLSMSKIQLFYVTLAVGLAYATALGSLFVLGRPIAAFPALDNGLIALLGISNAGHLASKAIPRSRTGSPDQSDAPLASS
jgi:hypothetical protein